MNEFFQRFWRYTCVIHWNFPKNFRLPCCMFLTFSVKFVQYLGQLQLIVIQGTPSIFSNSTVSRFNSFFHYFQDNFYILYFICNRILLNVCCYLTDNIVDTVSFLISTKNLMNFFKYYPNRIELVFHTENSMKYRSLHTILKYRFNIPKLIFHVQNIGISYRNGMLKWYLRIVCKDRYFILFSV